MYHYTYVIFKRSTGEYYIGVHTSKLLLPNEDKYMGSPKSKGVRHRIKTEGDWEKFIIKEYDTRKEAFEDEYFLTDGHLGNDKCLNRSRGGHGWKELSKEAKIKHKIAVKIAWADPARRAKQSATIKSARAQPGAREKASKIMISALAHTKVDRDLLWANPETREHRIKLIRNGVNTSKAKTKRDLTNATSLVKSRRSDASKKSWNDPKDVAIRLYGAKIGALKRQTATSLKHNRASAWPRDAQML